ncbi:N-acetyltransferase [Serratia marcescens]|jgi:N-acetylglutamate synthase-like GNAT family acetyltransferase|uniref:GNAT family N-acetyltransferase n=1 Tax=Serratia ureilytica TaxID=300181 RepID=A0ABU0VEP3_9GAMM|nr:MULTISPECIES: GNAT family N-acetyltransferase [Serratia]KAB5495963.1 GNAT family N-acetyltransferase [Enterobacter sp. RJAL6]KLE38553.1 GCN5 family acetyltransferase [Serratia sp. TEL]ALD43490.1 GCN5 family acetyltransferase [Serratia marcescens]ASL91843.1 N-acetyltransferase [Serratia marcescens]ASM01315.1 N-acetyltransferase [Serratia marcescens]
MHIEPLLAHRRRIEELAALLHQEWGAFAQWSSRDTISRRLAERCAPESQGVVLLALSPQQQIVGTASLTLYELTDKPERQYWLSEVFTHPQHRGQGIARNLIARCIEHGRIQGISELYLYTPDQQTLYQKLGWRPLEQRQVAGETVTVMSRTL